MKRQHASLLAIGAIAAPAAVWFHRRALAKAKAPASEAAGPASSGAYLLPVGTADTTASDVEAAVQPQIDAMASQIWRLTHPFDGTVPGTAGDITTAPPPINQPILIAGA